ncbi:MAG: DUF1287 domain-containing protein [Chromatiales bacterium]|nr:DUF1287 domain-containing protein [Chromatiales bacterium]
MPNRILTIVLLSGMALLSSACQYTELPATPLVEAARERLNHEVRYDAAYVSIAYPNGDVPGNTGVCTDVVIRAYRGIGIDLQQRVHEDMAANFDLYPSRRIWGLKGTDTNIDHRRVPNLQTFFIRAGGELPISDKAVDYRPGDLVTWHIEGAGPHIGIVSNVVTRDGVPLIIHNIGYGPTMNDMLFDYPITGHYRYEPVAMISES